MAQTTGFLVTGPKGGKYFLGPVASAADQPRVLDAARRGNLPVGTAADGWRWEFGTQDDDTSTFTPATPEAVK